jgi:NAD(P)-dependent dehydrogenase (short-subunit alcohol dehydrogenase family)
MRLEDKIATVVGSDQSPGEGMGNRRGTALRFAEEGAKVLALDKDLASAEETVAMARLRCLLREVLNLRNGFQDADRV